MLLERGRMFEKELNEKIEKSTARFHFQSPWHQPPQMYWLRSSLWSVSRWWNIQISRFLCFPRIHQISQPWECLGAQKT